jgi:hypothetical protein
MMSLALLLPLVNKVDEATVLLLECFEGMRRALGQDHPHTIACKAVQL